MNQQNQNNAGQDGRDTNPRQTGDSTKSVPQQQQGSGQGGQKRGGSYAEDIESEAAGKGGERSQDRDRKA